MTDVHLDMTTLMYANRCRNMIELYTNTNDCIDSIFGRIKNQPTKTKNCWSCLDCIFFPTSALYVIWAQEPFQLKNWRSFRQHAEFWNSSRIAFREDQWYLNLLANTKAKKLSQGDIILVDQVKWRDSAKSKIKEKDERLLQRKTETDDLLCIFCFSWLLIKYKNYF